MFWQRHWPARVDFAYAADITSPSGEEFVWRDETGQLTVWKARTGLDLHYRLRLEDLLSVDVLAHDNFLARARTGTARATLDHFLADQVIPRVVDHMGLLVLHAAAVRIGKSAILLMGESGRGKSTLAASFDMAGHALLGDDASVVSWIEEVPHVAAVYPSLRLLPDSVKALRQDLSSSAPVADYTSKRRLRTTSTDLAPLPLVAAYILSPPDDTEEISVRRASAADACMRFLENSFALDPTDSKRARARFEDAGALARSIPAFDFCYPRHYDRLPDTLQAIIDHMAEAA